VDQFRVFLDKQKSIVMEGKLIIKDGFYELLLHGNVVGRITTHGLTPISVGSLGKLSLKNCRFIELGYDIEELSKLEYPDSLNRELAFRRGFEKAIEVFTDKNFTRSNIEEAIEFGIQVEAGNIGIDYKKYKSKENQFLESIQKKEWDIEIDASLHYINNFIDDGKTHIIDPVWKPTLDSEGCLILKPKNK
jgi:hypothetical protein